MGFYRERNIKAVRRARACAGCCVRIEVGEPALDCSASYQGDFWAAIYHHDCRQAEIALNKNHDIRDGDDWMNIGDDMEWEDWPWLIGQFPAVAARMNITTERFEAVQAERESTRKAWAEIDAARRAKAGQP